MLALDPGYTLLVKKVYRSGVVGNKRTDLLIVKDAEIVILNLKAQ